MTTDNDQLDKKEFLTVEECALLKQSMFKALNAELDPGYRIVAVKDLNQITQTFYNEIRADRQRIGAHKPCTEVIREHAKDYKGIIKAVGYDSPNQKFKDILAGKAVSQLPNSKN